MTIKVIGFKDACATYQKDGETAYKFVDSGDVYDWLVVYDELREPTELKCPSEHTILATCEPVSIKHYGRAFTRQFAHLLTNRPFEAECHPGYRLGKGYYRLFIGRSLTDCENCVLPAKTKLISTACSSKQMKHTKHFARYRLSETLARLVPGFEWYGHGVKPFEHKYEILDAYKYHVVVENHIAPHHWTEKLSDAFLAECLPFYAGDPRLSEDFPPESFIPIPIDDPVKAAMIINDAIANDEYSKRRAAVLEAKKLILEKYNFWRQVIDVIESAASAASTSTGEHASVILPRKMLRRRSFSAALEDGWFHLKQYSRAFFTT